jgi:AcrR family transcriptional regulator
MPPRPSRNLDRALLAAGRELFPARGCGGLSVREVAEAAGVNLGMFHYHFKTREAFLRAVLQSVYDEMYTQLVAVSARPAAGPSALEQLRGALRFMGRFVRANRPVLARVIADALCREPIALEFLRANAPRHLGVLRGLIGAAQAAKEMRPMPVPQAMGFCAGSLATPILFGGAVADSGALAAKEAQALHDALLSDAALDQRIDLALSALSLPPPPKPAPRRRAARGKKGAP